MDNVFVPFFHILVTLFTLIPGNTHLSTKCLFALPQTNPSQTKPIRNMEIKIKSSSEVCNEIKSILKEAIPAGAKEQQEHDVSWNSHNIESAALLGGVPCVVRFRWRSCRDYPDAPPMRMYYVPAPYGDGLVEVKFQAGVAGVFPSSAGQHRQLYNHREDDDGVERDWGPFVPLCTMK